MTMVFRVFVEKKKPYAVEAKAMLNDLKSTLMIKGLDDLRLFNRYDAEGIDEKVLEKAKNLIFSEPPVDDIYDALPEDTIEKRIFAVEYLPGQYDQRADSCAQCISILTQKERPIIKTAKVFVLYGNISDEEFDKIISYVINPVESRRASLEKPETLKEEYIVPTVVDTLNGFTELDKEGLKKFVNDMGLAMDTDDIAFCQNYFKNTEKRDPTITEIRMIDTYWSDHCRHTTFSTIIDNVDIKPSYVKETYDEYLDMRKSLYANKKKNICLMDVATIAAKYLKSKGYLKNIDESEEINACSIKVDVNIEGKDEQWVLMFKNETHNHPTEIEPFGGAATCLGGAIRDPLSGRSYVYQAMRVTGAKDPTLPLSETMKGKLSQRKITTGAAAGYSSYGNQIGLATGIVDEIYHDGYAAKRLEIGAVVGAAPYKNIVRERPSKGDKIILLGGKTGRDGCGGATGSSKSHTVESLSSCGAEVQKGNPAEERKIQRLFRNPKATTLIKRCNDFGAGGVSVAIGEIADGLIINLDKVSKKYDGLDGTELAISESQERMAVAVADENVEKFISLCDSENIEAHVVAEVTDENRLKMIWNGNIICNISRDFLNSNGAEKHTDMKIPEYDISNILEGKKVTKENIKEDILKFVSDLNICSKKGLVERFDSTIGANTVLMPYGGKYQLSESQVMAAKFPVEGKETNTASVMSYGMNPYVAEISPYHGALYSVVESVTKLVSSGCDYKTAYLTLQEYFERTKNDPKRWGKPLSALLGALKAQCELNIGAIGGKDSMSGTFENIDVPPTLCSFAITTNTADKIISTEFKDKDSTVYFIKPEYDKNNIVNFESLKALYEKFYGYCQKGIVKSAFAISKGGILEAVLKMSFGNKIGFMFNDIDAYELTKLYYGGIVFESNEKLSEIVIGTTTDKNTVNIFGEEISLDEIIQKHEAVLEKVFPIYADTINDRANNYNYESKQVLSPAVKTAKPKVFIPVFPGTNCEYDTCRQFEKYGAQCDVLVVKNRTPQDIDETLDKAEKLINQSNIIMIPGGFSGGDEPEGSGKFIATFFRNPKIKESVMELIKNRDGLMLGICNGFQALIKLGLVPYGEIVDMDENCPTLTFNTIGRHQSMMVNTKISSNKSPWLMYNNVGDIHSIAISHGEGRFVADKELISKLSENGQIATQYVDLDGKPTMNIRFNPNSSIDAIEGITSPDGRIFGKMGHSERIGSFVTKNVPGNKDQLLFKAGVDYFVK